MSTKRMPNRYDNMDFPRYEFREYPKILYLEGRGKGKPYVRVANAEEEAAAMAAHEAKTKASAPKAVAVAVDTPDEGAADDIQKQQIADARSALDALNWKYDKRWGLDKLQAALTDATTNKAAE